MSDLSIFLQAMKKLHIEIYTSKDDYDCTYISYSKHYNAVPKFVFDYDENFCYIEHGIANGKCNICGCDNTFIDKED